MCYLFAACRRVNTYPAVASNAAAMMLVSCTFRPVFVSSVGGAGMTAAAGVTSTGAGVGVGVGVGVGLGPPPLPPSGGVCGGQCLWWCCFGHGFGSGVGQGGCWSCLQQCFLLPCCQKFWSPLCCHGSGQGFLLSLPCWPLSCLGHGALSWSLPCCESVSPQL